MEKFRRSWQLFKSSLVVMSQNKKLLLFPILIAAVTAFMAVLFFMPIAFQRTGYGYGTAEHWQAVGKSVADFNYESSDTRDASTGTMMSRHNTSWNVNARSVRPMALAYFAVAYFVSMFVATFLNVAFYREILNALSGQPVSVRAGIQFACTKWKIILMWTLFAGLVGTIIRWLEQRFGIVGQWIMKLVGAVWSVACVFVIPVIVTEEETANPVAVLKKSAITLTRTWGESLIGYVGVSAGGGIIMLGSMVLLGAGIFAAVELHSLWLGILVVAGWLAGLMVLSYLMSVASQIFRCALYLYATQGNLPQPYNEEMMALAWKTKKS